MKVGDVEFFVGSVEVIVGQAEAHHYAGNFQDVLEVSDNRDGAAAADEDCFFLECIVQGFGGGFDVAVVGTNYAGRALAPDFDLRLDAFGRQLLHEGGVLLEDLVRILVGNKAHGNLGLRFRGNYGFGAGGG